MHWKKTVKMRTDLFPAAIMSFVSEMFSGNVLRNSKFKPESLSFASAFRVSCTLMLSLSYLFDKAVSSVLRYPLVFLTFLY
jgi:hypothetical protein